VEADGSGVFGGDQVLTHERRLGMAVATALDEFLVFIHSVGGISRNRGLATVTVGKTISLRLRRIFSPVAGPLPSGSASSGLLAG
jgi:hypothetical protein